MQANPHRKEQVRLDEVFGWIKLHYQHHLSDVLSPLSTPPLVDFLTVLGQDPTWQQTTAYGRAYYLEQAEMMEQMRL